MTPPLTVPPPPAPGAVLVGLSGGLDSTVLLHLLAGDAATRGRGLRAVHVHHGLLEEADAWAEHCRGVCAGLDVPLEVIRVSVARDSGLGLEAAARQARYQAFESILDEDEILALAHHRDDQAETFLLRALRGSGVDGLRAMPAWRGLGRGWLWRPLLEQPRESLLEHAQGHGLRWVEDPTNASGDHDRNHLRLHVLPHLRERWPHAGQALARSASLAGDAARLLGPDDDEALAGVATADPEVIDTARLLTYPSERRARVLRLWLQRLDLPPLPGEGVTRIEAELLGGREDAVPEFAWSGARVRRWGGLLHASRRQPPLPPDYRAHWDGAAPLRLPTGDTLAIQPQVPGTASAGAPWPVVVHARHGGERIVLAGRNHSHALKHLLQDLGVPPWVRERLPLLSSAAGTLLAAGDLALSAAFEQHLHQAGGRLSWRRAAGRD